MYNSRFESDVLFAVRQVWGNAMMGAPSPPRGEPDIRNPEVVLHLLRDNNNRELLDRIIEMKEAYVHSMLNNLRNNHSLTDMCVVLTCPRPHQRHFTMNGLGYCSDHAGLALFNGLRHAPNRFCEACLVWNLLHRR